jgi:hypothetical protein
MIYVPWAVFIVGIGGLIWWGFRTKKGLSTRRIAEYKKFEEKVLDRIETNRVVDQQHGQDKKQDITEAMVGTGQNQRQKWN